MVGHIHGLPRRGRYNLFSVDEFAGNDRVPNPKWPAGRPTIIGVCGGSGSGKTTLAKELVQALGRDRALRLSFDSYYRDLAHMPLPERAMVNFDHPHSLDEELLADHLRSLRAGREVAIPTYDFNSYSRSRDLQFIQPTEFIIVEGILLFAFDEIRSQLDHLIFRRADETVRAERRLTRDVVERGRTVESVRAQWNQTVQPMHERFVEPFASHADFITTPDQELEDVVRQLTLRLTAGQALTVG